MNIGQMYCKSLSENADYFQVDICGKSINDLDVTKLKKHKIILHGDWEKKGFSSNDIINPIRQKQIIEICNSFKDSAIGITLHPPSKKITHLDFYNAISTIQSNVVIPIFIENRSNSKFIISDINSIFNIPKEFNITIDIPQLFINGGYDLYTLEENIYKLSKLDNIKELHIGGVKNKRVGQKLEFNEIDYSKIKYFFKDKYITLEILGGKNVFDISYNQLLHM